MKSKKVLLLTLTTFFITVAGLLIVLFIVFTTTNRRYYSKFLTATDVSSSSSSETKKMHRSSTNSFGKVTFLLGSSMLKKNKDSKWKKVRYGQLLKRGDSLKIGHDSKIEIALKDRDKNITIEGFKRIRIDSFLLLSDRQVEYEESTSNTKEGGKISRLTGKKENHKQTTPVSAIRSNKPQGENKNKSKLKTRIGN